MFLYKYIQMHAQIHVYIYTTYIIYKNSRLINTYLHCAIGQLHHYGCLGPEPLVYIRYSGKGVTLFHRDRATRLHQMLVHVFQKEVHQFHFLFEIDRILLDRVVQLIALAIDVVNVVAIRHHNQPCAIVVHHADAVVRQLVSEAVLIRVIHPLADPNYRLRRRISQFICKFSKKTFLEHFYGILNITIIFNLSHYLETQYLI